MATGVSGIGMTSLRTRMRMVERLRDKGIVDETVLAAMAAVPRHIFVEEAMAHRAYEDTALPLGHSQTISQPYIVARMIELLRAGREQSLPGGLGKTLEIGAGCGYQAAVLAWAPQSARFAPPNAGVFLGYDFHLTVDGPRLIEINTNAGGGLLNAKLARAQRACCATVSHFLPEAGGVEAAFLAMFREEWRLARGEAPLRRIAIVDTAPAEQYLAPEFELFRRLFEAAGIAAVVADPGEFTYRDGVLWHGGQPVDLVYNRLTDFSFDTPASCALRDAWFAGSAVITPHPRAHALYADKRNLVLLSNPEAVRREAEKVLASYGQGSGHVFNLSSSAGERARLPTRIRTSAQTRLTMAAPALTARPGQGLSSDRGVSSVRNASRQISSAATMISAPSITAEKYSAL